MGKQLFDSKNTEIQSWVIICYGNILRSQVLEQYMRYYTERQGIKLELYSVGIAAYEQYPDTPQLMEEVYRELRKRIETDPLRRNPWSEEAEKKITGADVVLVADAQVKEEVFKRMGGRIDREKVYTFYEMISEGEKDFPDTYDYELNRQDPVRFRDAFDELGRIAKKILEGLK
ncbi:MAG TPA: hypothetical protein PK629_06475 [Oscillospiraceae bacterium]|nr:hypothetical protein [Oscillospiraceae bacterium]HPF55252.1 hypothetical protein [Clostridiales bacterium]HPK36022.1 hypothetical protein [Oscillospiraceae bacterium]HPR76317.1 hypothetical protein [Oscillospiraceae bacterium]